MPQLPQITQTAAQNTGPVSLSRGGQGVPATGVGNGLEELGKQLEQTGYVLDEAYQQSQASAANMQSQQELLASATQIQQGGMDEKGNLIPPLPPDKQLEAYQKETDRISKKYSDNLTGSAANSFQQNFSEFSNRQGFNVRKNVLDAYQSTARGNLAITLQGLAQNHVNAKGDLAKVAIQQDAQDAILDGRRSGILSPEQAFQFEQTFHKDTDEGALLKMINGNTPLDAKDAIDKGEFKGLKPEALEAWRQKAISRNDQNEKKVDADTEKADRKVKKQKQELDDATFKKFVQLAGNGALTSKLVNANVDNLTPEHFEKFMDMASGRKERPANPVVYADLYTRVNAGENPEKDLRSALVRGDITISHFDALSKRAAQHGDPNSPRNVGMKQLMMAMTAGPGVQARDQNVDKVAAMQDYNRWADENPKSTQKEYELAAGHIAQNRSKLQIDNYKRTWEVPAFMNVLEQPTRDSLKASYLKLEEARKNGQMDDKEFNRQVKIHKRWDESLAALEKPKETK